MSRLLRPTCVSTMRSLRPSRGADVVFHLAGIVSIGSTGMARLREVNVEGTRNVIAACRAANVRRLIYTSSVHAFVELPPGTCLDETTAIDPDRVRGPYATTKAEATTLLVFAATGEGLDAFVVFPSGIIGPFDFRPLRPDNSLSIASRVALRRMLRALTTSWMREMSFRDSYPQPPKGAGEKGTYSPGTRSRSKNY